MANCKSCYFSEGYGELVVCTHVVHEGVMIVGEHDCEAYIYEAGTDESEVSKWIL